MKSILLSFILLLPCFAMGQTDDFQHRKDSLLKQISVQEGVQKLQTYDRLCHLPYDEQQFEELLKYIHDFANEANKQNNIEEEAYARGWTLTSARNYGKYEYFFENVDEHLQFFL